MKKQTDITKDQYKFFKDQINVIDNNKEDNAKEEDDGKTKDDEMLDKVGYFYIGDEYKI